MLETRILRGVLPEGTPREVERELRQLLERGVRIRPAGAARKKPKALLANGYAPKQRIRLFDTTYYLTDLRYEELLLFFVAYVLPRSDSWEIYPRIVCKDYSLVWRAPTHFIRSENENWMGKGDVRSVVEDGQETLYSAEETTNLPLEIQSALDAARSPKASRARRAERTRTASTPRRGSRGFRWCRSSGGRSGSPAWPQATKPPLAKRSAAARGPAWYRSVP